MFFAVLARISAPGEYPEHFFSAVLSGLIYQTGSGVLLFVLWVLFRNSKLNFQKNILNFSHGCLG
jgi:hypothetical protein